jgi:HK97 family phage prohead protease
MHTTEINADLVLDVREDQTGDVIATFHGRAVPYGEPTRLGGGLQESFQRDAFDPAQVIGQPIAYRHGEPIGIITGAENQADGLYIDGNVLNTTVGRDAAILAKNRASRGLSVGFEPVQSVWSAARDHVKHVKAQLLEVSLTHMPAYAGAGVGEIREDNQPEENMQDTNQDTVTVVSDIEAREAIAAVREHVAQIEARAFTAPEVHPLAQFRSFGDYCKAVYAGQVEARALDDQVPANNEGVIPPMWMQDVKRIVDLGRPAISSVGGPESAGTVGLDINWPYYAGTLTDIVAQQADPKDEVNSVQIDIDKGSATLDTWAAGSDIAYQLLQRSSPSYLDAHNRIMAASYAAVTDRAFTNQLWTGASNTNVYDLSADTTGAQFREEVFLASMECQDATGAPAEVVLASTALMQAIGGWSSFYPEPYGVQNVSGTATAATLRVSVSGLPVVRAKWLDTDADRHAIVLNRAAARWIEDGPRLATVENVAQLGRDIAIYGYGITAVYAPAGVVRLAEN